MRLRIMLITLDTICDVSSRDETKYKNDILTITVPDINGKYKTGIYRVEMCGDHYLGETMSLNWIDNLIDWLYKNIGNDISIVDLNKFYLSQLDLALDSYVPPNQLREIPNELHYSNSRS